MITTYRLLQPPGGQPAIECLICHRVSYHPADIANKYCGACHRFHETDPVSSVPITETDAMLVTILAVDALSSLSWDDMDQSVKAGAFLLFESLVRRVEPHLPPSDPRLAPIYDSLENFRRVAASVRQSLALPPIV